MFFFAKHSHFQRKRYITVFVMTLEIAAKKRANRFWWLRCQWNSFDGWLYLSCIKFAAAMGNDQWQLANCTYQTGASFVSTSWIWYLGFRAGHDLLFTRLDSFIQCGDRKGCLVFPYRYCFHSPSTKLVAHLYRSIIRGLVFWWRKSLTARSIIATHFYCNLHSGAHGNWIRLVPSNFDLLCYPPKDFSPTNYCLAERLSIIS